MSGLPLLTKYIPLGPLRFCNYIQAHSYYTNVVRQLTKKDAYSSFEYALKAPETKRQWPRRLDVFLTFLQLEGQTVKERTNNLYDLIKTEGIDWLESHIIDFIYFQKQRVITKEKHLSNSLLHIVNS